MVQRLRFLLDTNILIPLQDSKIVLRKDLRNFMRLCNEHGHQLLYHTASIDDIQEDQNEERRNRTLARLEQYTRLQQGPHCPWNRGETSTNDARDNEILYALKCNAAHALVTEDIGIHRKARERGLSDRVYFIQSANDWLRRLHEPGDVHLANIDDIELHTLMERLQSPFFDSIRDDYDGFDDWFSRKAREGRHAWVYRDTEGKDISAICIYTVQTGVRITDAGDFLPGDALKLSTFKVGEAVRGRKIGELFLRAAFQYATRHRCGWIFLHVKPEKQAHLTEMIEDFGFQYFGIYKGDSVYVKDHPVDAPNPLKNPFEYVRRYYPQYMSGPSVQKFLVPILPKYHDILFPDWRDPVNGLPAGNPQRHVGNAIKLAYLCHAQSRQPRIGDIVLFYRTHNERVVTSVGVIERYSSSTSSAEIAQLVSRRTVYSLEEIESMAQSETKVMLFRLIEHLENPMTYVTLKQLGVVNGPIQSITKISDGSFSRIIRSGQG
ncbi:GNAT family N-acetyltransferase [Acidithiobacillus ferriphilus]|uniref:GNAT family N-acetyltransferase n=1 Tax=Acidithiobacillus ferriphilus TaxID=1689834 RepID=UPI001C07A1FC|nr:GNAT family N-acetyltransferase [Acidithiobacillus ferriphilus]MBU2830093.1 N-acetyltransferase [Acidithiobacillus ferriphilus]